MSKFTKFYQNFTYDFFFYKQAKVIRGGKIVAQDIQEQETQPLNHRENCPNKMYKKKASPPPTSMGTHPINEIYQRQRTSFFR